MDSVYHYEVQMHDVYAFIERVYHELIVPKSLVRDNTIVVGLTRGGLIPAVLASHRWDIRMEAVDFSSRNGNGDNKVSKNKVPETVFEYPNVVVLDEICDSGRTLAELTSIIQQASPNTTVYTATVTYKKHADSVFRPDYVGTVLDESMSNYWIVFPWEMQSVPWSEHVYYSKENL